MDNALRKRLAIWLFIVAFCVFCMVVIGGLTRLTGSGLSIVEWKPVSGVLPPLTLEAWEDEFAQYRTSPEYQKINKGMSLEEFKGIFWLEYWHRIGGRAIGLIYLLPMLYFFLRYSVPLWLKWRLGGLFVLGGLQGVVGWYMVASGLVDVPSVSQYRLALHLGIAFLIMAGCIWVAREVLSTRPAASPVAQAAPLRPWLGAHGVAMLAAAVAILTFVQVLLGALVAGLDAGLTYNTFPLMDGRFVPKGLYMMDSLWRNHFENITMVQFQHRIGAYVLAALIPAFTFLAWPHARRTGIRAALVLLVAVLMLQIGLGIVTLVQVVPIVLASKHQAVAAILFALTVWVWYDFRRIAVGEADKGASVAADVDTKWQAAKA